MRRRLSSLLLALVLLPAGVGGAEDTAPPPGWTAAQWERQQAYETRLAPIEPADLLARLHDLCCERPHPAGYPGDAEMIARLSAQFTALGLPYEVHDVWAYLPKFVGATVEVVDGEKRIPLPVAEHPLAEDPYSTHPELTPGWNAYSGSGDVTAGVVYANYGRKADFETLAELGVSCAGKIVVARYGGNYRGFKAKFAEAAGAVGLIMYTDPGDSGYCEGICYPEGGYANEGSIQRGSIKTLAYAGDPLTPFEPATKDAQRLDPQDVALPKIPVQPLGWIAAKEIIGRMRGPAVPKGWQGGLPSAYRVTGGPALKVRLRVEQSREVTRTANVIGTLRGARYPEQKVIVGCHFDAWTFGAGDPHAGTIVLFGIAEGFARAAKQGTLPDRTIVFANWGAEEYGIIGSTEWCEANRDDLRQNAIAYVNLDMAAMGPNFRCSADPLLEAVVREATKGVHQPGADQRSVYETWAAGGQPKFGNLGGGSDHVGFYCHLGIPSMGMGGGGSKGVSYHSAHDNLTWYRQVVGSDYAPARMLTAVGKRLVARLANAPLAPYSVAAYGTRAREHVEAIEERAAALGVELECAELKRRLTVVEGRAQGVLSALERAVAEERLDPPALAEANALLRKVSRAWLDEEGLPGRPWYRNLFAASDPDSGYAAWMLPLLREAVERKDPALIAAAQTRYAQAVDRLDGILIALGRLAGPGR